MNVLFNIKLTKSSSTSPTSVSSNNFNCSYDDNGKKALHLKICICGVSFFSSVKLPPPLRKATFIFRNSMVEAFDCSKLNKIKKYELSSNEEIRFYVCLYETKIYYTLKKTEYSIYYFVILVLLGVILAFENYK